MPKMIEIQEKRLALHQEAQAILAKEVITADDSAKFDTLMGEVNSLAATVEQIKKSEAVEAELRSINFKPETATAAKAEDNKRSEKEQNELELRSFYKFCMKGRGSLTAEENAEIRTAESTVAGHGGDLIPPAFQRNLEVAMKFYCPFSDFADVIDTPDGAPMIWPVSSNVSRRAQLVPEGSAVVDADISTGKVTFNAYKFGDLVKVGCEISQDSFVSVDGLVVDAFAQSFGRALTEYFTTGTGVNQPTGIVTAATAGNTSVGDDIQTTPNPVSQIGYLDILNLFHSVDPSYRAQPGAKWMFNDTTLLILQKLRDTYGHPLWQPSFTSDAPSQILGKGYVINPAMADVAGLASPPAGGGKCVLFGDLSRFKVRRVKNMTVQVLVERYAEFSQRGIIAWARYDSNLLDAGTHPVKYMISG